MSERPSRKQARTEPRTVTNYISPRDAMPSVVYSRESLHPNSSSPVRSKRSDANLMCEISHPRWDLGPRSDRSPYPHSARFAVGPSLCRFGLCDCVPYIGTSRYIFRYNTHHYSSPHNNYTKMALDI